MKTKILFILKNREQTYDEKSGSSPYSYGLSTGLKNSVEFVAHMLNKNNIEAKVVIAIDNNCIDRLVKEYKPTIVIIEAFWVVPEKFDILTKLHPTVKWIVRNHSEIPFLSTEGSAMGWLIDYVKREKVFIATNSHDSYNDISAILEAAYGYDVAQDKLLYLPNYYKIKTEFSPRLPIEDVIDVGCFCAIRPLKNQVIQAVAAIEYAQKYSLGLRFHINAARIEGGNPVLKTLRSLFNGINSDQFQLIEHPWLNHDDFLQLVAQMDIGLQVTFTETFNIVTADFVASGVPIIVSKEIKWMPEAFHASSTDSHDIVRAMEDTLNGWFSLEKNLLALDALHKYNNDSEIVWVRDFG